jgi:hypothetical protein
VSAVSSSPPPWCCCCCCCCCLPRASPRERALLGFLEVEQEFPPPSFQGHVLAKQVASGRAQRYGPQRPHGGGDVNMEGRPGGNVLHRDPEVERLVPLREEVPGDVLRPAGDPASRERGRDHASPPPTPVRQPSDAHKKRDGAREERRGEGVTLVLCRERPSAPLSRRRQAACSKRLHW